MHVIGQEEKKSLHAVASDLHVSQANIVGLAPWLKLEVLLRAGQCELHEGCITHMALVENGSLLVTISSDGIMLLSSVDLLVKGLPIGHRPVPELPPVHLMRHSDLTAMDDRLAELKNQVTYCTTKA